ncbi:MAG TPA: M28 family peptidase [Acidimicrobiales bacterium]|nr:M28 family peptidase [Acidimicrobiales bacterium]
MRLNRTLTRGAAALALLTVSVVPVTTAGAADPHDEADALFDSLNGPMAPFVVTPGQFDIDPTKVLADVPAMMAKVDGARARATVEGLVEFPRNSDDPQSDLDEAADHVAGLFDDAGLVPQFQDVTYEGKSMPNIYAAIPGTGCSDKTLVVSAHYDATPSGNQGADDDASGIGALFEIARAVHTHPLPVTVRIVAFSFEEDGLVGSMTMAARDAANDADIVGAVSMDMLGYTTPEIDPLTGLPGTYLAMVADPTSAALAHAFGAGAYWYQPEFPAAGAVIDPAVLSDIFRSDHFSYVSQGYPGMIVTDTANFRNPNYHTLNDTLDTLDWDYLTGSARAMVAGVATYASSDQNADGVADLCAAPVPPVTTNPSPTTAPSTSTPSPANPHSAPPALALSAEPVYAG